MIRFSFLVVSSSVLEGCAIAGGFAVEPGLGTWSSGATTSFAYSGQNPLMCS